MATLALVQKAVLDMKDRTGSSLIAINKWIETNEKVRERTKVIGALFCLYCPFIIEDDKIEPPIEDEITEKANQHNRRDL